jgi:hypothetical protein
MRLSRRYPPTQIRYRPRCALPHDNHKTNRKEAIKLIDPISALAIASSAVGQIRSLLSAGRDASGALSKFAGALSDINYAAEKTKDPPFYKSLTGSAEKEGADAFIAAQKVAELKKDLEITILFFYGMKGVEDYKATVRRVRDQRQKQAYRQAEIKEALIAWFFGLLIVGGTIGTAGYGLFLLGQTQGKW